MMRKRSRSRDISHSHHFFNGDFIFVQKAEADPLNALGNKSWKADSIRWAGHKRKRETDRRKNLDRIGNRKHKWGKRLS